MDNFREIIDKSVEESRVQIAHTAGHLAVAHQSFANDYLLNVANQALFMLGTTLTAEEFETEIDGLRKHLVESLRGTNS
ncbi:Uncharacterised protein [Acinetobacter baumannii]|uniref:hypothetical protein n=1 Tax=Acinetobacter calcoaceticus/baumannii complex TaxID=909768 RepID=UPI0008DD2FBB|nr:MULTISPECIES: hypothetical protein [Acinetobacter]MCJ9255913.1 hypothetical protein [Acinetobacter baumannii]MCQ1048755.1 hypothetical protein [Acinetobacter baumannii]MCQ1048827.1 hypothetical protein [Acinetobacter baumannii]OID24557.1 hypothetical protein A7L44_03860 [Acinetobacter pittii]SSS39015.1 Uncharacterised protein [Acinetobacter baumannii]